jgi:aminoglycoside 3-N-acetyltransferase
VLTYRDFIAGFRKLEIDRSYPVIVHASLSVFGEIKGGVDTVLEALLSSFDSLVMPVFTYKTMVIPEVGPPGNGLEYGSGRDTNCMAEMFHPAMPADKKMGVLAELFRNHPRAYRSVHPILSFAGINVRRALETQQTHEPLLPIQTMIEDEGWVLLLGANHSQNVSIHYAEKLAGRKQFIRWALTERGIISCWGFPGCSDGFEAISPRLEKVRVSAHLGGGTIQAFPMVNLIDAACGMLKEDPLALLCGKEDCLRCVAIRASFDAQAAEHTD